MNESKSQFFEKMNKFDILLVQLLERTQIKRIRNEQANVTADRTNSEYYKGIFEKYVFH